MKAETKAQVMVKYQGNSHSGELLTCQDLEGCKEEVATGHQHKQ